MSQADVPAINADGNTQFHKAARDLSQGMEELGGSSKLGVDVNKPTIWGVSVFIRIAAKDGMMPFCQRSC